MGTYKYIRDLWKKPKESMPELWKQRLVLWRKQPVTIRIERPTRLDRARSLGYRAKQGIIIARQRVLRGGRQKPKPAGGRRPKRMTRRKIVGKNYQQIAEERAARAFKNCQVLNSYYVAHDGKHYWYEVILVDKAHPSVLADKRLSWIAKPSQKGRAARGITSAGKKSRGLRHKGKGAEKARPSRRAKGRRI
jgi:large subunit ribosomal protein L15e